MTRIKAPFIDNSGEKSTATFNVADAIGDAAITAVIAALDGVTLGNRQDAILANETVKDAGTPGPAASPLAQREIKWLVRATDDVNGRNVQIELPTADLTLLVGGNDFLVLTDTEAAALVTALEANVLSVDDNAISVVSIQFVGRNI